MVTTSKSGRIRIAWIVTSACFLPIQLSGCHGDCFANTVNGQLLNASTREPLGRADFIARLLASGQELYLSSRLGRNLLLDGDGSFSLPFGSFGSCARRLEQPDQFEITVFQGSCEHLFLIDLTENTVVDFPVRPPIELKEPILVPMCEE